MNKRDFLRLSAAAGLSALARPGFRGRRVGKLAAVPPIGVAERRARVEKAQRLMRAAGIDALLLEAGSSLL